MKSIPDRNYCNAPIEAIRQSPENDELYGVVDTNDAEFVRLVNDIAANGVREPICVSLDNFVMSGHRRLAASKEAGKTHIPTYVMLKFRRETHSSLEWKRVLASFNKQRKKSEAVRLREIMLELDPDVAYEQLITQREERNRNAPPEIDLSDDLRERSGFAPRKMEMLRAAIKVVEELRPYWPVTVRQVHYGLLNDPPMRNTSAGSQGSRYVNNRDCYSDLCDMLARARLEELVPWEAIADETRPVSGAWYHKDVASFVDADMYHFLRGYRRDLLQSQPDHVELIVEKMTLQSILQPVAQQYCVPLTVARGYSSLSPRYDIVQRYRRSGKDQLILLIASDFDPDGEMIAESFARSIRDDFDVYDVVARKVLLRQDQVEAWKLADNQTESAKPKPSSAQTKAFVERYGMSTSVYELEAVAPERLKAVVRVAIEATIDIARFNAELVQEKQDAVKLQALKTAVTEAFPDLSGNEQEED